MNNGSKKRLEKLERGCQAKGERVVYSDGSAYGIEPIAGGWAIFLHEGLPCKALPRELWDAWG